MIGRVRDLSFVLCLLLRRVLGDFLVENLHLVNGLVNQHVTLPCSFTLPDNWKGQDLHITWYRNFTDKLLDCSVKDGLIPLCQKNSDSSRLQLTWKFLGDADLDIYSLQESDAGQYQCWIIFQDAYQRQNALLHVHSDNGTRRKISPLKGLAGLQTMRLSMCNILLLSGWPFALLLAGILLSQRYHNHRKKSPGDGYMV